ncbi:iron complex transport system permease protein [Austwickia chelonae]|uniref:Putative iron-siderophore ABC transporter permease protein n=1 Tax=Austwickia chelonae NBRC 105200 TaxID=1184607 RepID=K6VB07_9MICO|nr:iron chelate uptake ABC transporter family permease subunit [Austwickia chelonae]GAB79428.1 putative iron-siderophore ABC transporter permease protein [Austwickia chelonae NBRC 105200]SEW36891.1 iron complex transport system permease protein [Austwickia chelonae]
MTVDEAALDVLRCQRRVVRRRRALTAAVIGVLLVAAATVRVLLGDYHVTPVDFVRIVTGETIPGASFIVLESKLPRALTSLLAGALLGAAGTLGQSLYRNSLASPDILGLTGGATTAAVVAIVLGRWSGPAVTVAAAVGALVVAAVLLAVGGTGPGAATRAVLTGVGISTTLAALVHAVLLRADLHRAHDALVWITGSTSRATWTDVVVLAVLAAVVLPWASALGPAMQAYALGDDLARSLGVRLDRVRVLCLAVVVVMVAAATAVCGPIAFVALLSGQMAGALARGLNRSAPVGTGAAVGALLVVVADHVAAYALPGTALPVGVVTGLVGAFFLGALLWRASIHREGV